MLVNDITAVLTIGLGLFVLCRGNSWTKEFHNVTVAFHKGAISVSNGINSMTIAFTQIYELADNGATRVGLAGREKHRFDNFDGLIYDALTPGDMVGVAGIDLLRNMDNNITAFRKTIRTTLIGPSVDFSLQIFVYNNDTIIFNKKSGERYEIYNGTVKVAATLDWKFCGDKGSEQCISNGDTEIGAFLDLYVNVSGTAQSTPIFSSNRGVNVLNQRPPKTFNYGGSDVTFSKKYIRNFTSYEQPADFPGLVDEGKDQLIGMRIPKFPREFPVTCEFYINLNHQKFTTPSSGTRFETTADLFWWSMFMVVLVNALLR